MRSIGSSGLGRPPTGLIKTGKEERLISYRMLELLLISHVILRRMRLRRSLLYPTYLARLSTFGLHYRRDSGGRYLRQLRVYLIFLPPTLQEPVAGVCFLSPHLELSIRIGKHVLLPQLAYGGSLFR